MGRKAKYTPEQRKLIKHYRNQEYYYNKVYKDIVNNKLQSYYDDITNEAQNPVYNTVYTLQSLRSSEGGPPILDFDDSNDPLLELVRDLNTYIYENNDFRLVLIGKGYESQAISLADKIMIDPTNRLTLNDVEPIEDFKKKNEKFINMFDRYTKIEDRRDMAYEKMQDAKQNLRELLK